MKNSILLPLSFALGLALPRSQEAPAAESPLLELRSGVAAIEASARGDKLCHVRFPNPMNVVPVVTGTVVSHREEEEHFGIFAVTVCDVTREGFSFAVQEADRQLRWGEGLELNWIATSPNR